MRKMRNSYQFLVSISESKIEVGSRRYSYESDIERDVKEVECCAAKCIHLAQWRAAATR